MSLTDTQIKNAKPRDKVWKLSDERGLYLEISPSGGKHWRMKFRFDGRENRLTFGGYPDVSLAKARELREEARKLLAAGENPALVKKKSARTFSVVATEWHNKKCGAVKSEYLTVLWRRVNTLVLPHIGHIPIERLTTQHVLETARGISAVSIAKKMLAAIGEITRYARICGYCETSVGSDLGGVIQSPHVVHRAAIIEAAAVGKLLRDIDAYWGTAEVRNTLRVAPYLFLRSSELCALKWEYVRDDEIVLPEDVMKGGRNRHIVPLAKQVKKMLERLPRESEYVFPGPGRRKKMRGDALMRALSIMGYSGKMTAHGFRGTASTLLNEMGYMPDVIERQLAHVERNRVRAAYNHAEYLPERRKLMQDWADYLDKLRDAK